MRLELTGEHFGRWTVVNRAEGGTSRQSYWLCRCECGALRIVQAASLRNGRSQSCGCLRDELAKARFTTHGETISRNDSKERRAWKDAKARCHNPKHHWYHAYGAKGVRVCSKWRDNFAAFLADMGRAPSVHHSLDRINPAGDYEPSNCRWADAYTQAINTRIAPHFTILETGERLTIRQFAIRNYVDPKAMTRRISLGETPEKALRSIRAQRPSRHR